MSGMRLTEEQFNEIQARLKNAKPLHELMPILGAGADKPKPKRRPKLKSAPVTMREGFLLGVSFILPIKLVSEANQHEHWTVRHKRNTEQQEAVRWEWQRMLGSLRVKLPVLVRFTRIGVQMIDPGNLEGAFKHVQDAIAAILGVDDGDREWIRFEYDQETGAKEYAVKVEIAHEEREIG